MLHHTYFYFLCQNSSSQTLKNPPFLYRLATNLHNFASYSNFTLPLLLKSEISANVLISYPERERKKNREDLIRSDTFTKSHLARRGSPSASVSLFRACQKVKVSVQHTNAALTYTHPQPLWCMLWDHTAQNHRHFTAANSPAVRARPTHSAKGACSQARGENTSLYIWFGLTVSCLFSDSFVRKSPSVAVTANDPPTPESARILQARRLSPPRPRNVTPPITNPVHWLALVSPNHVPIQLWVTTPLSSHSSWVRGHFFLLAKWTFDRHRARSMKNFDSFYGTVPVQSPGGTPLEAAAAQEHALSPHWHRNVNRVEGNYI